MPTSFFGKLFSPRPTRMSNRLGSIYAGMCHELEPEKDERMPVESWNASIDPRVQQQRYRSDSDLSVTSTTSMPVRSPVFDVPRWTWPENDNSAIVVTPISEPLKPISKV